MLGPLLRGIWAYRGFIIGSVKREFQVKYRYSLLGALWTILQPLAQILVYTVIFSQVMRAKLPGMQDSYAYSIYLCGGILTWGLFAEITTRAMTVFLDHSNLMKKVSFPRICLPVIVICNALINFSIIFGLFVAFLLLSGHFPGWPFLALLPLLLLVVMLAIGIGMLLGVLNVFFRDVGQLFSIVIQFWFWLTPVVYAPEILPPEVRDWIGYNPMAHIIGAIQYILLHADWPDWSSLWPSLVLALLLCAAGLQVFRKRTGEMVDEL